MGPVLMEILYADKGHQIAQSLAKLIILIGPIDKELIMDGLDAFNFARVKIIIPN